MTTDKRTEADKPRFVIDLDNWNMRQFSKFTEAVREGNYEELAPFLAKVIVSWPYASDPNDPESILELNLTQFSHLMSAMNIVMGNTFSQGN